MKKWLKSLVYVAEGFALIATTQVEIANADPIKTRRAIMKELSGHNKAIKKYLMGHKNPKKEARLGTAGDMEFRALAMAGLGQRLLTMFPKGTSLKDKPGKTRANDLENAAATGDKAKIAAAMKGFGKTACGTCHKTFRGPKPKKKKTS